MAYPVTMSHASISAEARNARGHQRNKRFACRSASNIRTISSLTFGKRLDG